MMTIVVDDDDDDTVTLTRLKLKLFRKWKKQFLKMKPGKPYKSV